MRSERRAAALVSDVSSSAERASALCLLLALLLLALLLFAGFGGLLGVLRFGGSAIATDIVFFLCFERDLFLFVFFRPEKKNERGHRLKKLKPRAQRRHCNISAVGLTLGPALDRGGISITRTLRLGDGDTLTSRRVQYTRSLMYWPARFTLALLVRHSSVHHANREEADGDARSAARTQHATHAS
jgi:hypothetical protein